MQVVVLDLETYFSDDYTLSKMTTEEYIRDPRFIAHGAAIKWSADTSAQWYDERQLRYILKQHDWSDTFLISHHAQFDHLILSHHYDVHPKMSGCTLSMARLLLGNHLSVSLDAVRKHFNMPMKTTPYNLFKGKHWHEMDVGTQRLIGEGACDEVESIFKIFGLLHQDFPAEEYEIVDSIIKMFSEPALIGDIDMLAKIWTDEEKNKNGRMQQLWKRICETQQIIYRPFDKEAKELVRSNLQSADRFAQLLRDEGIEPEMKDGKKKQIYAFAKTDQFMRDLLESNNDRIRTLAEARLGEKSTIMQTRAATFGWMARRGPLCVYLNYAGAGTLRPSGGDSSNFLNLKRRSPIRPALKSPPGYLLAPIDASQIECIAENEMVLTSNGTKAIQYVTLEDLVWDGIEWVRHEGVVCKGKKPVIFYQGLTATPEHVVYVRGNSGEEKMEMRVAAALAYDLATTDASTPIRQTPMRKSFLRRIQDLWCQRHKIQIQIGSRLGALGRRTFAAQRLSGSGDRSHRQRWPLCPWEFEAFNTAAECQQSLHHFLGANEMRPTGNAGFQTYLPTVRLWPRPDQDSGGTRTNRGTDYSTLQKRALGYVRTIPTKETKVYDIVNAGPRHRFTVSGVLVSNCRVLHYLAGGPDEPVIQKFRNNEDPYVDLATQFYGEQIYKPKANDPRKDEMEAKRGMGKQGRLMCGYGAAGKQFRATAKNGQYGPPVDIPIDDAIKFVSMYRTTTRSVCAPQTGYWSICNFKMLPALANGHATEFGPLTIKDHRMFLPNGAMMIYDTLEWHIPDADEECRDFERDGYWRLKTRAGWKKMWGAKLTQNICEAVSRVIVSQALIRIKRMGFRTLNWPYDELCLLMPDDSKAEENLQACIAEMKRTPDWLPGIPLDCEGSLGERYSK